MIDNRSFEIISAPWLADSGRFLILLTPPISTQATDKFVYLLFTFDSMKNQTKQNNNPHCYSW